MGYGLHITRKADCSDTEGPRIGLSEWEAIIASDPELALDAASQCGDWVFASFCGEAGSLAWVDGEIRTKNPDTPRVIKMVAIARRLNAQVQGDDGEIYREDGSSFHPEPTVPARPVLGLIQAIREWFRRRRTTRELWRRAPTFKVGDRVRNVWGDLGTVVAVDRREHGGLGSVRFRLDNGLEHNVACAASGLQVVRDTPDGN